MALLPTQAQSVALRGGERAAHVFAGQLTSATSKNLLADTALRTSPEMAASSDGALPPVAAMVQDGDKSPHFQLSLPSTGRRVKRVTVSVEQTSPLKATFVKSGPDMDNGPIHTVSKTPEHSAAEEHEHTKVSLD